MEPLTMQNFKESFAIADNLARASMMTSPAARKRLAARSIQLKFGSFDESSGDYVPPKEFIMYLSSVQADMMFALGDEVQQIENKLLKNVTLKKKILERMGSFSSTPKIINEDILDHDVRLSDKISYHDLLQLCKKQNEMHPMVKRLFRRPRENEDSLTMGLKARKLNGVSQGCSEYISNPQMLRILQWNVLSQTLGQFNDHFAKCPDKALEWNNRRFHLVEEIIEHSPDIICLQEVDHFNFLKHVLNTQGYMGMFFPKPDSPCIYIDGNNGPDGCAIFYRRSKFEVVKSNFRILEIWRVQSNQVAMCVILRVQETGQEVCIVTTHLKARKGALLATLRNEQGRDLLQFLATHCGERPIIMCGDFNAEPSEPVYSTITNNPLNLSSAYADCQVGDSKQEEPPYTTWKIRDEGEVCHTIDYVFYSKNNLEVDAVLEFPTAEDIGPDRVPSFSYPSDHFSLVCDFKLGG